jgi:hypothetical protein
MKLFFDLDTVYYTNLSKVIFRKPIRKTFLQHRDIQGRLTMEDLEQEYSIEAITAYTIQITYSRSNHQDVNITLQPYYHLLEFRSGEFKRL